MTRHGLRDRDGKLLAVLEGHAGPVTSAAFALDSGRMCMLTASTDNTARLREDFPQAQTLVDRVIAAIARGSA
jgi:hypothetical protein